MKILNVSFVDQAPRGFKHDELYLTILEDFKELKPIRYRAKKVGGFLFKCIWYEGGLAMFGALQFVDPLHGNRPYTWSSNASYINAILQLEPEWQLAKWNCVVKSDNSRYSCWFDMGLTKQFLLKTAKQHPEMLHYTLTEFCRHHDI